MPVPNTHAGFALLRYKDVYGITNTLPGSPIANQNDIVINTDTGEYWRVTSVSNANIPTLERWEDVAGDDGSLLNKHPSQYSFFDVDALPELGLYHQTSPSSPYRIAALPDKRILLRNAEISHYRLFLGTDISEATGNVISGRPESGTLVDHRTISRPVDSFLGTVAHCFLSYELLDGEVVTMVVYDNTNNILAVIPMVVRNRGSIIGATNVRTGIEILSPYVSDSDPRVLDCRFQSILAASDFNTRIHFGSGLHQDIPASDTTYQFNGLDSFLADQASNLAEVVMSTANASLTYSYTAIKGGLDDDIGDSGGVVSGFDWNISPYDLGRNATILNGNNRPQAVSAPILLYPKGTWANNARPLSVVVSGTYFGSTDNGVLGEAIFFDKAGNIISYNQSREYVLGSSGAANQFTVRCNLYHVANLDIGGVILRRAGTDMTVNAIVLTGTWSKPSVQFGVQAAGGLLNYIDSTAVGATVDKTTAHKRSLSNEKPIAQVNVLETTGGLPYHWPASLNVSGVGVGNWFVPYYSTPVIPDQGMEFLGTNVNFADNKFVIETVMKITGDFTLNPALVTAGQAPTSPSIVNVRPLPASGASVKYKDYSVNNTTRTFTVTTAANNAYHVIEDGSSVNQAYLELLDTNPTNHGYSIIPNNSSNINLQGAITIEWRARVPDQSSGKYVNLFDKHDNDNYTSGYTLTFSEGIYTLQYFVDSNTTSDTGLMVQTHQSTDAGEWHDIAMMLYPNGRAITYVDGTLDTDVKYPSDSAVRTSALGNLVIGAIGQGDGSLDGSSPFDLDYIRITQGLRYDVFNAVRNAIKLACEFEGTNNATSYTDNTDAGVVFTGAGTAKISTAEFKWGATSLRSGSASGDYFSASGGVSITGNFFLAAWVKLPSSASGSVLTLGDESANRVNFYIANQIVRYDIFGGALETPLGGSVANNVWTHVAWARIGNQLTAYVNGAIAGTVTETAVLGNLNGIFVGRGFDGYIDDLVLINGIGTYPLTGTVGAFTTPTRPLAGKGAVTSYTTPTASSLSNDSLANDVQLLMYWQSNANAIANPYLSVTVGDNEMRVYPDGNRVEWLNEVEGLNGVSQTGLLNIIRNTNPEVLNVIALVRNGASASIVINGTVAWSNNALDYDEDTGPQRVSINWRDTPRYGFVPYIRSVLVYSDAALFTQAQAMNSSLPMNQGYLESPSAVRMEGITQQPSGFIQRWMSTVLATDTINATASITGDAIAGTYPNT